MEYASVYALQNWARKDPAGDITFNNLKLIRAFENHEGSEKGFMYVLYDRIVLNFVHMTLSESIASCMLIWYVCVVPRRIPEPDRAIR
jgi:hypothetical protein